MSYQWGVNESDEKELIRVSIVNDKGLLVFDSIIQPSKRIKYAPLFDASFGIPLKYLSEMLNTIFEQRIIVGFYLQPLVDMLKLNSVFSIRDLALCPEINSAGFNQTPVQLAKQFFDMEIDEHFRSTITEARLFFALYKNFEQEVDDVYLKQSLLEKFTVEDFEDAGMAENLLNN